MAKEIEIVKEYLQNKSGLRPHKTEDENNPQWDYELFADYNDRLDERTIGCILRDKHPLERFKDELNSYYTETIHETIEETMDDMFLQHIVEDHQWENIENLLYNHIHWCLPYDHFLNQSVNVDICIDTGDYNVDGKIDPHASLVWLAEEQGYSYADLNAAIADLKNTKKDIFLESVHDEVYNASGIGELVFLVNTSLKQAIDLITLVSESKKDQKHLYKPYLKEDHGHIVLDKHVTAGLFDPWNGGGSTFGLEFTKEVTVPIKYIQDVIPDTTWEYPIKDVYGFSDKAWGADNLKAIKA